MSKIERLAEEIVRGYFASDAYEDGRAIFLEGGEEVLAEVYVEVVRRVFESGKPVPVFIRRKVKGEKIYSVDLDSYDGDKWRV
jgi:hypothetical protein